MISAWFELKKSSNGQYRFVLKSQDEQILLMSEHYRARNSALNGITSVQRNYADHRRYEPKTSANGRFLFNLKAANHQIIGTSPMYATEQERDSMMALLKRVGGSSVTRELGASSEHD